MRVVVDFDKCDSNKACMVIAPQIFEVREDNFLYVLDETPPESMRERLERCVKQCPKSAIQIVDD